jgi:hypothetical protein
MSRRQVNMTEPSDDVAPVPRSEPEDPPDTSWATTELVRKDNHPDGYETKEQPGE